jgi:hypothetical protein
MTIAMIPSPTKRKGGLYSFRGISLPFLKSNRGLNKSMTMRPYPGLTRAVRSGKCMNDIFLYPFNDLP